VAISNLSLVNGKAKGADGIFNNYVGYDGMPGIGGAVLNQGMLTVTGCTFEGNTALGGRGAGGLSGGKGGDGQGGAIANQNSLSVIASTLAANSALGGMGGLEGFEIQFSRPGGVGSGGAIYNAGTGTLSLTNCTVTDNTATGANVLYTPPFSLPGAAAQGGGVANLGTLTIVHSTLANNTAIGGDSDGRGSTSTDDGGASFGGGLYSAAGSVSSTRDTIFAPNAAKGGAAGGPPGNIGIATGPDVNGMVTSQGHNLLGRSDGCTGFTTDDQQGGTTDATRLDPKLGALGDYGGPTQTLPLLLGSPAIDRGDTAPPARDLRYFRRTGQPDIGAFEYQGTQPPLLANISTRVSVQTGDNAMIGGFIITGPETKTVIVRGIGPSLPVPGALADLVIEVHGSSGELLATNDNWRAALTSQDIIASGLAPASDLESALYGTINPGAYTVVIRGRNDATGLALFEVYDLDHTADSKLANVSTRGFVGTGDNVMIGGTIIVGSARVLLRAIGPSLTNLVPNALGDPVLELHDGNGGLITVNDDWRDDQEADIIATGLPPLNDLESAIVRDLAPGPYTAILRGKDNTTGVAVVEVYNLD
jgi:hypothetical protein